MIDQKAQDYFYKNVWQSNIHLFKHSGDNLVNEINKLKPTLVIDAGCGLNFFKGKIKNLVGYDPVFKEAVKVTLTPMLASFSILVHVPIDTEQEMFGYGVGVILLNIRKYFVAPAVLFTSIKKKLLK